MDRSSRYRYFTLEDLNRSLIHFTVPFVNRHKNKYATNYIIAHKPDSKRDLSIKARLFLIATAMIIIYLIFYLLFGVSIESELDNYNPNIIQNIKSNLNIFHYTTTS